MLRPPTKRKVQLGQVERLGQLLVAKHDPSFFCLNSRLFQRGQFSLMACLRAFLFCRVQRDPPSKTCRSLWVQFQLPDSGFTTLSTFFGANFKNPSWLMWMQSQQAALAKVFGDPLLVAARGRGESASVALMGPALNRTALYGGLRPLRTASDFFWFPFKSHRTRGNHKETADPHAVMLPKGSR